MAKSPIAPVELPPGPSLADPRIRLYRVARDVPTGCFAYAIFDVPESILAPYLYEVGEPRHMPGTLMQIERDVRRRDEVGL